jgi:hypothetical protein
MVKCIHSISLYAVYAKQLMPLSQRRETAHQKTKVHLSCIYNHTQICLDLS